MNVGDLTVTVRVTEGDALFDSLRELAEMTRQQSELATKISDLSREIMQLISVNESLPS